MEKSKKKFLVCFLTVIVLAFVAQLFDWVPLLGNIIPKTRATDSKFVYEVSDSYITIVGYSGDENSIMIPDSIDGVNVLRIGDNAFSDNDKIVNVTVPKTVISIGDKAFSGCDKLTEVSLPQVLQVIGDYAFADTGLKEVIIPSAVMSVGSHAFAKCPDLTGITLSASMNKIEDNTFENCISLEQVDIPGSVTGIGAMAFSGCESLSKVNIPASVISVGQFAFQKCTKLADVTIPDSVTTVDQYAFMGCNKLKKAKVSANLREISEGMFSECTELETADIPKKIVKVGAGAFMECSALTEIDIPDSVSVIEDRAFLKCEAVKKLTIGNSVKSIGMNACYNCKILDNVMFKGAAPAIGDNSFYSIAEEAVITVPKNTLKAYEDVLGEEAGIDESMTIKEGDYEYTAPEKDEPVATAKPDEYLSPVKTVAPVATVEATPTVKPTATVKASVAPTATPKATPTVAPTVIKTKTPTTKPSTVAPKTSTPSSSDEYETLSIKFVNDGKTVSTKSIKYNSSMILPDKLTKSGYQFVGWAATVDGSKKLYRASSLFVAEQNVTFKAVWLKIYMLTGASIRLSSPTGIRFATRIETDSYDTVREYANSIKCGTLICPTSYLSGISGFTKTGLDKADKRYLDIKVAVWYGINKSYREFTGVMTNVKESNYNRRFSARAYMNVTYADGSDSMFYSSYSAQNNSRTVYMIAKAAIADKNVYTDAQKKVLQSFINSVEK